MTLIHRSPEPDLEITGSSSGLPLCFVDAGQDFTAQDLASMDPDDLEQVLDASYAPDQSRSSHVYGFSCDESEIIDAGALDLDEQAAKDLREALGLDAEDRFDVDAHNRLDLLDDPDGERRIHLAPEEVLNGEHENVVDAIDPEASWRVQEVRAETAARAGYVAVRDWDENGEVLMVAPHEVEGDLNDRLFYVAQDPEHVQNRTPEMEAAESYGEEMRLQIDARLEAVKNREDVSRGKEPELATPEIDGPEPVDPLNYVAPPKPEDPFAPERAAPSPESVEINGIRLGPIRGDDHPEEQRLKEFHAAAEIEDAKRWEQELSHNVVTSDPFEQAQEAPGVLEYDPTGETEVPAEFRHSRPEAPEKLGPTTFEELRQDAIESGASSELVGGPAFLREERLKHMITELDHELDLILPEGYRLDATVPGRGEDQDFPVGVLRGPNGLEERFERFGLKDEIRVEGVAFNHEDRERGREQDARERGVDRGEAGRDAGGARDGDDRERDEGRGI